MEKLITFSQRCDHNEILISFRFTVKTDPKPDKIIVVCQKNFNLKTFSEIYSDLCDSIELINSTFTFHLVYVMTSLLIIDVFTIYAALREFNSKFFGFFFVINFQCIVIQYLIKSFAAHAGSSTTKEAAKAIVLVTKMSASSRDEKTDLDHILHQMQVRNKNLENIFFAINWNLIFAVSFSLFFLKIKKN